MQKSLLVIAIILVSVFRRQGSGSLKYTANNFWHFIKDNSITDVNQYLSEQDKGKVFDIPHTWNV